MLEYSFGQNLPNAFINDGIYTQRVKICNLINTYNSTNKIILY